MRSAKERFTGKVVTITGAAQLVSDTVGALDDAATAFATSIEAAIPLRWLGTPDEIAGPLLFLASDDAAYMVGSDLVVDGGYIAV